METKGYARKEVREDGTVRYYDEKGDRHREGGPALECADGTKAWYRKGDLHREDGPAYEGADGSKEWYRNGKCHREDGPAVERADGTREYWLSGKRMTEEEFRALHPEVFVFASSEVVEEESPGPGH